MLSTFEICYELYIVNVELGNTIPNMDHSMAIRAVNMSFAVDSQ